MIGWILVNFGLLRRFHIRLFQNHFKLCSWIIPISVFTSFQQEYILALYYSVWIKWVSIKQHDKNKITINTFNKGLEKAGKILLVSNVYLTPEDVFLMYKIRDTVEKHYGTYINLLEEDKLYLQDNELLFSVIFSFHFCLFMDTQKFKTV